MPKSAEKKLEFCVFCQKEWESTPDEIIAMAITCLAEFVNRSPEKAAQILPDLIENLSHYVLEGSVQLSHIARHMMRCILQQLKTNKLLSTIFMAKLSPDVFTVMAMSRDVRSMSLTEVLNHLLDKSNEEKILKSKNFLHNFNIYLEAYDYFISKSFGYKFCT